MAVEVDQASEGARQQAIPRFRMEVRSRNLARAIVEAVPAEGGAWVRHDDHQGILDKAVREAVAAIILKPHDWSWSFVNDSWAAKTPIGTYTCPTYYDQWDVMLNGHHIHPKVHGVIKAYPTLEAARAKAWEHYKERIMEAFLFEPGILEGR